ncbi:hypothetical protein LINGRAHAP2_LOCUS7529, partial [Linum grandiflorum]
MQWYLDRTHPHILRTIAECADCPPELLAFRILDGLHSMLGIPVECLQRRWRSCAPVFMTYTWTFTDRDHPALSTV